MRYSHKTAEDKYRGGWYLIAYIALSVLVIIFAMNMGGATFPASFAAAYGSKSISKLKAQILFIVFVFLGAALMGSPVASTLGNRIIPAEFMKFEVVIIILISATFSLFIANILHVGQSTSLVTVAAIAGVGLYFKNINTGTLLYFLPFWIILPLAGYVFTYFLGRMVYPPGKNNFWIYEKLVNNSKRLKTFVIVASCYNAFSIGTNNVANAVGPLAGADIISRSLGLIIIAPIFGVGSLIFSGSLKTAGDKIAPIGLLTATIVCFVTGSLMIVASLAGVPQSFVMINIAALFAVSGLKNGHKSAFANPLVKKTYLTWVISPIIAFILSYLLISLNV